MERDLSSGEYRSYMKSLHGMDLPREFALPEWAHTGMGLNAKKALKGDVGTKFGFMTPKQMKMYFEKEHGMVLPELRIEKADDFHLHQCFRPPRQSPQGADPAIVHARPEWAGSSRAQMAQLQEFADASTMF
ncbi:hypothetical protein ABVK25_008642 [Lepraria finkii]|uniref:Uncharacterized protein n=1 Tax=Lepraria finkii TaxID=1340010 RepID=A0ABR4B0V4_9LECA